MHVYAERTTGEGFSRGALEPWQLRKLKKAYFLGKRNISVSQLCGDIQLPRIAVLKWLREYSELPDSVHESDQHTLAAEDEAIKARREALRASSEDKAADIEKCPGKKTFRQLRQEGVIGRKRINRTVENTLEMVYERQQWPTDEVLRSLWDLHKVPRHDLLAWFEQRRRQDGGKGRRRRQ